MKRKLRKFFLEKKDDWITLKDLQTVFMYMKKNDRVVIHRDDHSFVFHYDYVELGSTDGEWFHTVMNRTELGVVVVPEMKDYLKDVIRNWIGDLEDKYLKGLNLEHPLYLPWIPSGKITSFKISKSEPIAKSGEDGFISKEEYLNSIGVEWDEFFKLNPPIPIC